MENVVLQHKYLSLVLQFKCYIIIYKSINLFQLVLNILLEDIMMGKLSVGQEKLQGLMAYSERHYRRLTTLLTNTQFLRYTTNGVTLYSTN